MSNISVSIDTDIFNLSKSIKEAAEGRLTVIFAENSLVYKNVINLKLIERVAEAAGKTLELKGSGPKSNEAIINYTQEQNVEDKTDLKSSSVNVGETSSNKGLLGFIPSITSGITIPIGGIAKAVISTFMLLILLAGGFLLFWYLPSANVELLMDSEVLVKNVEVIASSKETTLNIADKTIPAVKLEAMKKNSDSVTATGKKEVGEKAKGVVKFFNKTDSAKSFNTGTKLTLISSDVGEIIYTLLEDVKIPAKEVQVEEAAGVRTEKTVYGSAEAEIEAIDFGTKYNVDSGEKFKIEDLDTSEYLAENEKAISGGSSKIVLAISQGDKDALKSKMDEQIKNALKMELEAKVISGQELAENSVNYGEPVYTFSKNVGDEADKLDLTVEIKGTALAYNTNDLQNLVKALLEKSVPDQYSLPKGDNKIEIGSVIADASAPQNADTALLQVKVRSYVVPKIDLEQVKRNLTGKSFAEAEKYLYSVQNVSSFKIDIWPEMPKTFMRMPRSESKINVTISGN